jgi:hypothetical protein
MGRVACQLESGTDGDPDNLTGQIQNRFYSSLPID